MESTFRPISTDNFVFCSICRRLEPFKNALHVEMSRAADNVWLCWSCVDAVAGGRQAPPTPVGARFFVIVVALIAALSAVLIVLNWVLPVPHS